ncbi:hypothetical protein LLG46_07935 [bacterium]|nr:hypothetical protein [bacterium]
MFKFPEYEPEISITAVANDDLEIECTDNMGHFIPLHLGGEGEFAFYDYPKEQPNNGKLVFTGAHLGRVTRRIRVDDFEILEVEARYREGHSDYPKERSFWNHIISEGSLKGMVEIETPDAGVWAYKSGTTTPKPRLLKPGLEITGHEPVYTIGTEPEYVEEWVMSVGGVHSVRIGSKEYRCLQVTWANPNGKRQTAVQFYVADNGRTVFSMRYNGPTYPGYEDLAGHPEIEYRGITWRHWYDSIPDIALIVGL